MKPGVEVRAIDNDLLFEEVRKIIGLGESVSIRVSGRSMMPTFIDGKDVIVISPFRDEDLQAGAVVLFDRGDAICVHRIIERSGKSLIIRGDGNGIKSLEPATVDDVIGLVTAGTMKGGRHFRIEDEAWKRNTRFVLSHFPLIAHFHHFVYLVNTYKFSALVLAVLLYLSFFNPSGMQFTPKLPYFDKMVHFIMYFCVSLVFWFEWLRAHGPRDRKMAKGMIFCVLFPIMLGGAIEGLQGMTGWRSAELWDFVMNCAGTLASSVIAVFLLRRIVKPRPRRRTIRSKILNMVALSFLALQTALLPSASAATPKVKPGIEVLQEMDFAPLKGKRVGLVTNPSGVDHMLRSTIDILYNAGSFKLVALFGPEHGVRGDAYAGGKVENSKDPVTGLPVYSLYGETRKPTPEMLSGIDVMVYDIQDVGVRCYTFISTLGLVMEACAPLGIEVVVLDRPNPLGGEKMEGCLVERPFNSFVSQYRIPFVYGLTPGELATMINEEGLNCGQKGDQDPAKCSLTVIPMKGWTRGMTYDRTGLPWVPPSPNIPYDFTAPYYAAAGPCGEIYGYLQVGLNYTLPFQLFAAAWIDAPVLLDELKSYELPGVSFRTVYYKPFAGSQAGKLQQGVQMFFTDYKAVRLSEIQFYVIQALAKLYPTHLPFGPEEKIGLFNKVCGTDFIKLSLSKTYKVEDILPYWRKDEDEYRRMASKYFLY